jgi:type I restriction enzyme, S subunit
MIANLQPYPEYKESGSRWLAEVPSHWKVRNLRTLIRPRAERNRPDLPLLSVAREKGVFVRSLTDENENHNVIPEDLSNYKVARAGNLVINKMKAWQGSMGIAPCDGIVSPAYFVFDFAIANHAFGQILLRSKPYVAHFGQASDGVRVGQWDLTIPAMRQIPVLLPSPEEQTAIVQFLDYANGRLERTIRAKQKVIALLNEQKQAIIHRAVTRGLDANVPLKPSDIPWLGDIPQHWEVAKIGQKSQIARGRFSHRPRNAPQFYGGCYPFIQTGDISAADKHITGHSQTLNEKGFAISKLFFAGTLAMIITGAKTGHVAILNFDACFPDSAVGFYPDKSQTDKDFLYYLFIALRSELERASITSTQENLNVQRIRSQVAAWPALTEQKEIANYLDRELKTQNTAITRLDREIELLREYRTRLVADVVTGKLDVRPAARKLPEMADKGIGEAAEPDAEFQAQGEEG